MGTRNQESSSDDEGSVHDKVDLQTMLIKLHNEAYHCFNSEDVSLSPDGIEFTKDDAEAI